jgi:hypothetical protein
MRFLPAVATVAAALVLTLTGCVQGGDVAPSSSATPSEGLGGPSPSVTPEPSEPAAPLPAVPVTIDCNDLVDLQTVYDFNPNYGNQPNFTPPSGSNAATIAASDGTVCNWVNQTSGETFIVAVAQPAEDQLVSLKAAASSGTAVAGIGDAAYFSVTAGVGEAQVFSGAYWLVASSTAFYDFETAEAIVRAALSRLGG